MVWGTRLQIVSVFVEREGAGTEEERGVPLRQNMFFPSRSYDILAENFSDP